MKTNTQRRLSFYRFALSLTIALAYGTLFFWITDTHAFSPSYTIRLCEKNYLGANYKPHLEKTCSLLWSKWTWDILNTNN